jgi:hypothetical protein
VILEVGVQRSVSDSLAEMSAAAAAAAAEQGVEVLSPLAEDCEECD